MRFLWAADTTVQPPDIVTLQFTRVVIGVSSSPFLLNARAGFRLRKFVTNSEELRQLIREESSSGSVETGEPKKINPTPRARLDPRQRKNKELARF